MSTDVPENVKVRSGTVFAVLAFIALGLGLFISGCETDPATRSSTKEVASLPGLRATDIHKGLGYALEDVARTKQAPGIYLSRLDADLDQVPDVDEKKSIFFKIMLPIIARENDRLRALRKEIAEDPSSVSEKLYERYEVEPGDTKALLNHVDIVPASLVLAQAALESGWGTSRFARKGNNFFGIRTYDDNVPGIDPKEADGFKVRAFKSIADSVRYYMHTINTHDAYKSLRAARAKMRTAGKAPTGKALSRYLKGYSEIPEEYGGRLRTLMEVNNLAALDGTRIQ